MARQQTPLASNHRADWCLRNPASTNETVAQCSGGVRVRGVWGGAPPPPTYTAERQVTEGREGMRPRFKLTKSAYKTHTHKQIQAHTLWGS